MGDEQHGLGPYAELAVEPLADLLALHLVEGGEGLVHQQHGGIVRHGAGDVDPLQHAAGQFAGALVLVAGQAELGQHLGRVEADAAGDLLGEAHVVDGALPRQHGRPLGDEAELALAPRLGRRQVADAHLAARRVLQVGHDAQQRGLAAARWADEGDELAGGDLQVDRTQRPGVAETPRDVPNGDRRGHYFLGRKASVMTSATGIARGICSPSLRNSTICSQVAGFIQSRPFFFVSSLWNSGF